MRVDDIREQLDSNRNPLKNSSRWRRELRGGAWISFNHKSNLFGSNAIEGRNVYHTD
jgi:hypothetical protein